jgi:hypothetical protein
MMTKIWDPWPARCHPEGGGMTGSMAVSGGE